LSEDDIERLAELLRSLPPAPAAWVRAAKELPQTRKELDEIVVRAEQDAEFRRALFADLESSLAAAGYVSDPTMLRALRERLSQLQ